MTSRAKMLRNQPTDAEIRLWRLLHPLRTGAFHFRKQAPIGPYIVDFACHHAKLVIEVDGDTHALPGAAASDARRDAFLRAEGYDVLRFSNLDVLENDEGVFDVIVAELSDRAERPPRTPSPSLPTRGRVTPAAKPSETGNDAFATRLKRQGVIDRRAPNAHPPSMDRPGEDAQ